MSDHPYQFLMRTNLRENGDSRQLVLILHGAWGLPDLVSDVRRATTWILPDADQLAPHYLSGFFARCPADRLTREVLKLLDDTISAKAATGTSYEEVMLVGYSLGAAICFKIAADWGDRPVPITRIVSLGGTNFGWSLWPTPPHMMAPLQFITQKLMQFMASIGIAVTVRSFQQGRRFSKQLRDYWQRKWSDAEAASTLPWVIQINGEDDEFVGPWMYEDFKAHHKARVWTIPHTQHLSLLHMDDSPLGMERQLALKIALSGDLESEFYCPPPELLSGEVQPA